MDTDSPAPAQKLPHGYNPSLHALYGRASRGERFTLEQWYLASAGNERESQIIVDGLRRFGIDATSQVWGVQRTSSEERAKTSGMFAGSVSSPTEFHTSTIARPENRWTGANRYGYSHPEYDRFVDAWETTIDRNQRIQHLANVERIVNADLPGLGMYFRQRVLAYPSALGGVVENLTPGAGPERRIWEWHWKY